MDVQLPDGTTIQGVPDGTTKMQLAQKLSAAGMEIPPDWLTPKSPISRAGDKITRAVGEPALNIASGMAGQAAGGVAGIARGAGAGAAALMGGEGMEGARRAFTEEASSTIENVERAMPRPKPTPEGEAATRMVSKPFVWLAGKADQAGQRITDLTGSPALGALANVAMQSAPAAVLPAARGVGRLARGAEELTATDVPRGTPSTIGDENAPGAGTPPGPQQPAQGQGTAQAPQGAAAGANPNEARAQAYAGRIGLDWARLGAGTRAALTTIAQDAGALERLNPAAIRRQAHLQSLRVPVGATKGQLERDPVQLRREAIASNLTEGQPIRDIDIAANRDLQANLEILRGRVGGLKGGTHEPITEEGLPAETPSIRAPTKAPTQVGEAAQTAAREKAKWSKKGYQALYKIAEQTEPTAQAGLHPVTDLLTENPDIQHLGFVQSWLNKAAKAKGKREGIAEGEPVNMDSVTLAELYDLRKLATKNMAGGGTAGHYAAQLRDAIDTAMKDVPEGARAWKAATDAFRKHQEEFKDQGIVSKLVNQKKGGADRSLALEKTWKQIATGPLEQILQTKKTLLTGGTPATRMGGRRAWRDIRAETVNRILEDARNVTSADETERAILTEAALRRSMNRIPRENLKEILGPGPVRELDAILRARRITTRSPVGGRTTQSGTVPNALTMAEKVLQHIPGVKYVVGAKKAVQELGERGAATRAVREAPISPLEQAVRDVERTSRARSRKAAYDVLESSGPTLPAGPPPQPLPIGQALKPPP